MAYQAPLLSLQPLTPTDVGIDHGFNPVTTTEELQLMTDMINVLEKRVEISSFSAEYQKKIKDAYKYSATRHTSRSDTVAKRTGDTLDIV